MHFPAHHFTPQILILIYLAGINAVAFICYGIDKWKARHARWRIPESTLLLLALAGGSLGAYIGIQAWHHKTLHRKFRYGVPAILLLQLVLASWFLFK
ncbi:MAG: DUF1294 domain-containing protein [Bacteroidaceae bacterium]|nr:DUF1294 domain-containing protein [Bacteroidaceae bacterium]